MNKKGGLDLSINSIVVIIFAITMLGLGLMFIKGQFEAVQDKITFPVPDIAATPGEPIVLPFETLKVNRGTSVDFSFNFYNSGPSAVAPSQEPNIQRCTPSSDITTPGLESRGLDVNGVPQFVDMQAVGQQVDVADNAAYKALFVVPPNAASRKYICVLAVGGNDQTDIVATKQFFVEVK